MGKKGVTKKLSRAALALTEGLFGYSVDMALWIAIYAMESSLPQSQSRQLWRAQVAADRFLSQVNYEVIKHAIATAKKRGWMKTIRRRALLEITEEGKRRLVSIIPRYEEKRVWDGRMHLVTYDIPEKRRTDREVLREYLRKIGCGKLQDSVWMTPYNPTDILCSFIEERALGGTIIVSDLGQGGSIGGEDIRALIVRVYHLEKLNDRYEEWLEDVENYGSVDHLAHIQYLSILRDDPQLPFALLPSWWKGDEAYQVSNNQLRK